MGVDAAQPASGFFRSLIATSVFLSNVLFWQESGYFAAAAEAKPLLHTWSLAVEEQYYVFFPVLLWALWRLGRNPVIWTLIILSVLSLLLAERGWRTDPTATFYLIHTRAWELFAGSLAAFVVDRRGVKANNALAGLGLAAVVVSIFAYDESVPFPSVYALLPVGGVVLMVLYAEASTWTARLLGHRWLVGIGLISYSAYLWHQPLFAFARIRVADHPSLLIMGALSVLSFGLAVLSWRFVEQPFRHPNAAFSKRSHLFAASIAGLVAFSALGFVGHQAKGFVNRFDAPTWAPEGTLALPRVDTGYCFYSFNLVGDLPVGPDGQDCYLGADAPAPVNALLFGDSFAAQWEPFWDDLGKRHTMRVNAITTNWCFPALGDASTAPANHVSRQQCQLNRAHVRDIIADPDVIILAGAWHGVQQDGHAAAFAEFVDFALTASTAPIVILDTPVSLQRGGVEARFYGVESPLLLDQDREDFSRPFWQDLTARYGDSDRVMLLDRTALFGGAETLLTADGHPYSLDGAHVSIFGAKAAAAQFQDDALMQGLTSKIVPN